MFFVFPKQNVKFFSIRGVTLTVNQGSCGKQPAAAFFMPRRDAAAGFRELAALRVAEGPCQQGMHSSHCQHSVVLGCFPHSTERDKTTITDRTLVCLPGF